MSINTIAMSSTFTEAQEEALEMVLIAMLDSGDFSEEVALDLNMCDNIRTLRVKLNKHVSPEIAAHVINVVEGKTPEAPAVDTNVDLSEFFHCDTPEEAKALQSWKEVFDVPVVPNLTVIEEKPMKTAKDVSREFKAIVEARNSIESSQIVLDGIELKSSGAIATALVHALEKDGFYQQYLPEEMDASGHARYAFMSKAPGFDNRMVALLAVQLAGVLPYLDAEYDFEHVVATAVFRRRFRDIARANSFIPGAFNNMMDAAGTTHWHEKLQKGLELAIKAGLIDEREENGVVYIKHSQKYIGSCISRTSIMHKSEGITLDNRRKERVKGRSNPRKDGTSKEVREALDYIESQAQAVNTWLLDAINGVLKDMTVDDYNKMMEGI